ncbi:hypothetical protein V2W45_1232503, partial [Cenococcum geophilum]
YKKKYRIKIARSVAIVVKRPTMEAQFIIRGFSKEGINKKLFNIRQLYYKNIIVTYKIFACDTFYIVLEFIAILLIYLR